MHAEVTWNTQRDPHTRLIHTYTKQNILFASAQRERVKLGRLLRANASTDKKMKIEKSTNNIPKSD